jgi:hypothetical protein
MPWKKLLAWATGQIDEVLRQKLELVLEENRVYRTLLARVTGHFKTSQRGRIKTGHSEVLYPYQVPRCRRGVFQFRHLSWQPFGPPSWAKLFE